LLKGFLQKQGYEVFAAHDGQSAMAAFNAHPIQMVLLDHRMPDMNGDEVLKQIKAVNPLVRSIMITAFASVDTAVNVMKLGSDDFLQKPVNLTDLLQKIQSLEQQSLISEDAGAVVERIDRAKLPLQIIGDSPAMQTVLSLVHRVAQTHWTVLVHGETGTGKELIARLIHLLSDRSQGPFIEVNCAAIPENLFESELMGHEKGAFTGAAARKRGKFELARGGTLFLDETGELPLNLQAKLLRALQDGQITRVGSEVPIQVDVRVVAATNRDLRQMVADGNFRQDLFYRLNVLDIELPPLRQRKSDIPQLADFFLARYRRGPLQIDPEAMTAMVKHRFPGNVRELEHMIQRMVTLVRGTVIGIRDLPPEVRFQPLSNEGSLDERLSALERRMILETLEHHDWVQTHAAEALAISERVLRYKMKKHGICKP
jgi:two-component system response regulator AtoC